MKSLGDPKTLFSTVRPSKIPDILYKQLVSLITKGHIKPGERLPSERDLALELGVSRQSIREAVFRAKAAGLIEVRQGGGTFVISSLAGATHNVIAMHVMEGLKESFHSYFRVKQFTTRTERKEVLLQQHKSIYDSIRRKNPRDARKRVLEHLDYVEEWIREELVRGKGRGEVPHGLGER
jgi:DNA-binding FadR family transcriptional regulator